MSLRKTLGRFLLFALLELGTLSGIPMTPDMIEKLLQVMNQTRIVEMQRTDEE